MGFPSHLLRKTRSDEHGGIAILAGVLMPVLVGGMALGTETGALYMKQRKLQHAADMAAHAAAIRMMQGDSSEDAKTPARHIADASGYTGGSGGFQLFSPPQTAPQGGYGGQSPTHYVEVILQVAQPRYLTGLFGSTPFTLSARAMAAYKWDVDSGSQACILALSTTAQTAVKALGNSATNAGACDIASNSSASNSINIDNVTTRCVYTVGNGSASRSNITCGGVQATSRAVSNPYADRELPPMDAACTVSGTRTYPSGNATVANYTHPPGCAYTVFTGNVTFQKTVNLAPGYYVFKKKFTVDPNNSTPTVINGTGVTLIFQGEGNNDINTSGNGTWNLSAPTTGPTAGIAIWIPESSPISSVNFNASGSSKFTGAIYAPNVGLTMNGGSSNTSLPGGGCTQIIAGTVDITGGGTFNATGAGCKGTGTEAVMTGVVAALVE